MKFPVVLTAFLVFYPFTLLAAEEGTVNEDNTVIVTASRSAQTVDDALASVSVITAEDIADSQALSIEEVLEGIAGIDIDNNGGYGKTTLVFMRGTESDHVTVLIDGVRIGSATSGGAPWSDIALSQIERIEVVRGPRSSLYGSDAIGGVIQIFTKKGLGKYTQATLGGGNLGTRRMAANISSNNGVAWHNISMERFNTDGIDATDENFYAPEPDNDPYVRNSFAARGGVQFNNTASFDLNAQHSDGTNHYDAGASEPNLTDFVQQLISATVKMKTGESSQLRILGAQTRDSIYNYRTDGSVNPDEYITLRDQYSFQSDIDFQRAGLLITGIDYQNETIDSTVDYTNTSRYNTGVFAQYSSNPGRIAMQVAARVDDNEWFGSHTTGNFSISSKFKPVTVIASYGTAFRAPTFNDLFWNNPATPWYVGNPDLVPEKSNSSELELRGKHNHLTWIISVYRNEIRDLIAYSAPTVVNINKAEINGGELSISTSFSGIHLQTNYSVLDPRDSETDNILPRRSRQLGKFDISYSGKIGKIGLMYAHHGKRYDDVANNIELDSYAVSNILVKLQLSESWFLRARIDNLLDKEFQTANTYNQPGRTAFLSLHYE
jgi:vitamin B12 transporter